jgi:hypothetical protein
MSIFSRRKKIDFVAFIKANYFQLMIIILLSLGISVYAWGEYNRSNEVKNQARIEGRKIDNANPVSAQKNNDPVTPIVSTSIDSSAQPPAVTASDNSNKASVAKKETKPTVSSSPVSVTSKPTPTTPVVSVDPVIKIEKCKAQAKFSADKQAKSEYLAAMVRAQDSGDSKTAQFYLDASIKPEHPADYDANYQSEYLSCLDN